MNATELLEQARQSGTPLIEGNAAVFLWEGPSAPTLHGDFTGWGADGIPGLPLERTAANLWTARLELPPGAYMEYMFFQGEERLPDPYARGRVSNGMGKFNHAFYMPPGAPTPLARARMSVPRGTLIRHKLPPTWRLTGGWRGREIFLYQPPAPGPVPLLLVYDGPDYLRRVRLPVMIDNLIAAGRIQPVALALIANAGRDRFAEYSCGEALIGYLANELPTFLRNRLDLLNPSAHPGTWGVLGASMGGLMALYTGLRLPHIYGRVLAQSGAYSIFDHENVIYPLVEHGPAAPVRAWLDCGQYEWLLDTNRRMAALLEKRGYAHHFRVYPAAHNYPAWRDDLPRGLEWLYDPHS